MLGARARVGVLKVATTWPLPERLVLERLAGAEKVLVVEEVDPFLESNLKELAGANMAVAGPVTFLGKASGHIPVSGEITPDIVAGAIASVLGIERPTRPQAYVERAQSLIAPVSHMRTISFCAGCPHRATFWSIKNAIKLDGRDGFVTGDIGCYSMAVGPAGYFQVKTMQAMGSGTGLASGFGKLAEMGFSQPVLAVCGDSTFFHAAIPALVNGVYNRSNFTMIILDNSATAMTGFQPHPGTGANAMGDPTAAIDIEVVCRALGVRVEVTDPFDIESTTGKLLDLMSDEGGVRVLVSRRKCALVRGRTEKAAYRVRVDTDRCLGQSCGCDRLCTRVFQCPGLSWDPDGGSARIDEVVCTGCGVCADICPGSAIIREVA